MHKLSQLENIGVKFTKLLEDAGIEDQKQLLDVCCQAGGREALAKQTGINPKLILKWTTHADLARVSGIGEEYAELLEKSGVHSVKQLTPFNPEKLLQSMQKINEQTKIVHQLPTLSQIKSWIEQAETLPIVIYP